MYEVLFQLPLLIAQETLNPKIIDLIGQGVISVAILLIWFYTFKQSNKQQQDANDRYDLLATQNSDLIKNLFEVIKEDTEYKSLIAGILARLEEKMKGNNDLIKSKGLN